jgi:polyisoprenoid-binding protein YceI
MNSDFKIDEAHSSLRFSARHLLVAIVGGHFRRWNAELKLDETDMTKSSVVVTVEAASLDTGNPQRDGHLRSADFFHAEKFPVLTFRSRRIERASKDTYRLIGDLTIRGVTREVTFETQHGGFIKDPYGMHRVGFAAQGSVLRSDFGMQWNQVLEAGGVTVSDRIEIAIDIEAVAQMSQKAVA